MIFFNEKGSFIEKNDKVYVASSKKTCLKCLFIYKEIVPKNFHFTIVHPQELFKKSYSTFILPNFISNNPDLKKFYDATIEGFLENYKYKSNEVSSINYYIGIYSFRSENKDGDICEAIFESLKIGIKNLIEGENQYKTRLLNYIQNLD